MCYGALEEVGLPSVPYVPMGCFVWMGQCIKHDPKYRMTGGFGDDSMDMNHRFIGDGGNDGWGMVTLRIKDAQR